jgi:small subunit ribosomal protein S17
MVELMVKKKRVARNVGVDVKPPDKTCDDPNCCWHGTLSIRGKILEGVVVSARAAKTAIVERRYLHFIPKYERYERRKSRIAVHNPECVAAREGDKVWIAECRPLSKTKHFVILQVVK